RELREVPLDVAFAAHPLARELPVVALEQLLRNAFELEEQHVPRLLPLLHRLLSVRARVADRHYDEAFHPLRHEAGERPRETGAPVVPDDVRPLDLERVEDRDDVRDEAPHRIRLDLLWLRRLAEATQVRRDHSHPG